jgi:hypothetical protein
MPVIPDTWDVKTGGYWFEASLGKVRIRPYLKNKLKAKGLVYGSSIKALVSSIFSTANFKKISKTYVAA